MRSDLPRLHIFTALGCYEFVFYGMLYGERDDQRREHVNIPVFIESKTEG